MWSTRLALVVVVGATLAVSADDRASPGVAGGERAGAASTTLADDLSWWSVESGGGQSSGGGFELTAIVGQPEAGISWACDPVLDAGLWARAVDQQPLFCDGLESGDASAWDDVVGLGGE